MGWPAGLTAVGGRDPNKGVKEKGMVFEATEGTMRQAASRSSKQAAPATGNRADTYTAAASVVRLYSASKRRPATTCRHSPKASRLSRWRGAPAERNALIGRVEGRVQHATTRPARRRDMRAQEVAIERELQQPGNAWKDERR